jgi:CheY-like chemotaxis protein
MPRTKKVLWADDETYWMTTYHDELRVNGFEVVTAKTGTQVLRLLEEQGREIAVIILDIMMPPGSDLPSKDSHGGYRTGLVLAREIRQKYPKIPIIGCSQVSDEEVAAWFSQHAQGFMRKSEWFPYEAAEFIAQTISRRGVTRKPKCFIVHGHDQETLFELKDYLQNTLGFAEPVVLRDRPSLGRTIIEKFEEEARGVALAFVLLTPDDQAALASAPDDIKRRARQNVIFELGYFLAKLQRKSGRVVLLYKGSLELPSDISGIVYIDITHGITSAGEVLRRELRQWL